MVDLPPWQAVPLRVQRKRAKGFRLPPRTTCVTRPGPLGNPFIVGQDGTAAECVYLYAKLMIEGRACLSRTATLEDQLKARRYLLEHREELRGQNLACYCHLCSEHAAGKLFSLTCGECAPCHSDITGLLVNT